MTGNVKRAHIKAKQAEAILSLAFNANLNANDPKERGTIEYAIWAAEDILRDMIELLDKEEA